MSTPTTQNTAAFIWQVADDILRGTFKRHEYGDVTLPFVVLRRLDCAFAKTRDPLLADVARFGESLDDEQLERVLLKSTGGLGFFNKSGYDLERLASDPNNIKLNFNAYLNGFSGNVRDIIENLKLEAKLTKLAKHKLLFRMCDKFTEVDLHPNRVTNHEMGGIFEELLRKFSEMSNETAGEHYTPREVIKLMVRLLFAEHEEDFLGEGIVRTLFDPACGTGGMLTIGKEAIQRINPGAEVYLYGQESNDQTYAIAKSDFLITGENPENVALGSSLSEDQFGDKKFDFMLSNPPFGVSWKKDKDYVEAEAETLGGRFDAGTPRINDGSLLFLQHMLHKMQTRGSRIAVVFNGSPLFTGKAGSGESDIRRWIIESDYLEAIVALPQELFYNTGISTYIWLLTNRKPAARRGKVQLIDASELYEKMPKSHGNKRRRISDAQAEEITTLYTAFAKTQDKRVKLFDNADFGYREIRVERPELNAAGKPVRKRDGTLKPDTKRRDYERIPLKEDIQAYFEREVAPHVPHAWVDPDYRRVGYEINFTRYFYEYTPLRPVEEIVAEIRKLDAETEGLLERVLDL